jgi:hypothetical protein
VPPLFGNQKTLVAFRHNPHCRMILKGVQACVMILEIK